MAWLTLFYIPNPFGRDLICLVNIPAWKVENRTNLWWLQFLAKGVLKAEKNRTLCSPTFNFVVDKMALCDHDNMVGHKICTNKLLIDYFKKEENVAYCRVLAAIDVWPIRLVVVLELEGKCLDELYLPLTGCL